MAKIGPTSKRSKTDPPRKTQQVSDDLIKAVASGKMTPEQAEKKQAAKDAKVRTITKVGKETSGSSQNTASKRSWTKVKSYDRDNYGNLKAR